MRNKTYSKTKLATCLSIALGITVIPSALAQDNEQEVEVIEVTGIRSSQIKSMDIKRSSNGVVDSINAEDIGKFPDTNLAESLQRISGVSIDRVNGEGSKVTVRGFGPDFNLVTLNNRIMPTSQVAGESTRSFDFANLASESVSSVEIHKTGKANVASGGIGSTINIHTARPLQNADMVASFGIKGMHDDAVDQGDTITPELSGIFSNKFFDDKFGLLVSTHYKKRDTANRFASIDGWRQNIYDPDIHGDVVQDDREDKTGNTFYARNIGYGIENVERERLNTQVTMQYQPQDNLTFTYDFFYSKLEDNSTTDSWGLWFSGVENMIDGHIDENGTFIRATEVGGDYSGTMHQMATMNENFSHGFNVDWQVSDTLNLALDVHSSKAESDGRLSNGAASQFFIMGGLNVIDKTYDASNGDIPLLGATWDDVSGEYPLMPEHYGSLFAGIRSGYNESTVDQIQLDGQWINANDDALASIDFGVSYSNMETRAIGGYAQHSAGWYGNKGEWSEYLSLVQLDGGFLGGFSGGGNDMLIPFYYTYDQDAVMREAERRYGVDYVPGDPNDDHFIQEETTSAYISLNFDSEFNGMPLTVVTGFRYEQTDVTASSKVQEGVELVWLTPTEWNLILSDEFTYSNETHTYKEFLPSLDLALEVTDDLITRFSYSQTLTRPTLGSMKAATLLSNTPKIGGRQGSAGNPALKPFKSNNLDLSLEYYYGEGSYASVGWFQKEVNNFIMNRIEDVTMDGMYDPYQSEAAQNARAAIEADGGVASDEAVFQWLLDNGYGEDGKIYGSIVGGPDSEWMINTPSNVEDLAVRGWEMAIQHWFWDTGFGFSANYTAVSGDTEYDVANVDEQFALPGLSDTANFAVFYEDHGWQVRFAYNWRDKFLSAMGQAEAGGPAPQFTEAYGQLDASISYEVNENLFVVFDAINILEEDMRIHGRYSNQMLRAQQNEARYALGMRYTF